MKCFCNAVYRCPPLPPRYKRTDHVQCETAVLQTDEPGRNKLAGSGRSKSGTEHIIMQLRKAQDVDGNMDIQVSPTGKKVRLAKKDIDALLRKHDTMTKPRDKRLFRVLLTRKLRQK